MTTVSGEADREHPGVVVGVRTRGSDLVRWAVWIGHVPPELHQWVRLEDTGELGRVTALPGRIVGINAADPRVRVSAVRPGDMDAADAPPSALNGFWGRIGIPDGHGRRPAQDDPESPESIKYRTLKADMPALGSHAMTEQGSGIIIALDVYAGKITVRLDRGHGVVEVDRGSLTLAEPYHT